MKAMMAHMKEIQRDLKEMWKPLETGPQIRPEANQPNDDKTISKEKELKEQIERPQAKPQASKQKPTMVFSKYRIDLENRTTGCSILTNS